MRSQRRRPVLIQIRSVSRTPDTEPLKPVLRFLFNLLGSEEFLKLLLSIFVCLLLASVAFAQANAQPEVTPPTGSTVQELPTPGPETQVAPDSAVITIKGVCEKAGGANSPADCNTIVTREQFEKIVAAVQPNMAKQMQKRMATQLVQFLILAAKAHEMGLDHGPEYDEQMHLARMELLARLAGQQIQKDSGKVSDADLDSYYKEHSGEFKTISYDKIYVPRQKMGETAGANGPDAQKKHETSENEMKQEADKLRARAAAGEDFVKLQQEAYDFSGMKLVASASNTHVEKVAKAHMLGNDASIFDLKDGEISQVIDDPQGFMIYKVDGSEDQPLADVREEVTHNVQTEKLKAASESIQKQMSQDTTYNDAYFAVPAPPSLRKPGEEAPPSSPAPAPGKK